MVTAIRGRYKQKIYFKYKYIGDTLNNNLVINKWQGIYAIGDSVQIKIKNNNPDNISINQ